MEDDDANFEAFKTNKKIHYKVDNVVRPLAKLVLWYHQQISEYMDFRLTDQVWFYRWWKSFWKCILYIRYHGSLILRKLSRKKSKMLNFLLNNEENGAKSIISQIKLQNSLSLKKRVENSSNSLWNILFIKTHNYKLFINSISKVGFYFITFRILLLILTFSLKIFFIFLLYNF